MVSISFSQMHHSERIRFIRVRDQRLQEILQGDNVHGNFLAAWNLLSFQRGQIIAQSILRFTFAIAQIDIMQYPLLTTPIPIEAK